MKILIKVLIVEDIGRWERLITWRLGDMAKITFARSVAELGDVLSSDQKFFAVALDGWLGRDSTIPFIPRLCEISRIVISTSQDLDLRKEMIKKGCRNGGNKWDFVDLLTELSL